MTHERKRACTLWYIFACLQVWDRVNQCRGLGCGSLHVLRAFCC